MMDLVRAIVMPLLTVGGFGAITYAFLNNVVSVEVYVPMVSMMVAFWFAVKTGENGGHN